MNEPHIWMDSSAERVYNPAIEKFADLLLNRVLPLFNDPDAEQERASQAALETSAWSDGDYVSVMEQAYFAGVDDALIFMEIRSAFLATSVAGLFHLFEKQLYCHLKHELRGLPLMTDSGKAFEIDSWAHAEEVIRYFSYTDELEGPTLIEAFENTDLQELREVANAVKHGEGRATKALRKMNAPVVDEARLQNDYTIGDFSVLNVSISITIDDVIRYKNAILGFWAVRGCFSKPQVPFS